MAQKYLAPDPVQSTFFIPGGAVPGNGVQVFVYLAGTTTKTTVYKDDQGVTAWSNPIVLDSGGNLASGGSVWITQGETIKIVWAPSNDTDPPASPYRTIDDIVGINDVTVLGGTEWTAITTPNFLSASTFTLSGDQTSAGNADPNRRMKFTVTGPPDTAYGVIKSASFASGSTTIQVNMVTGALDSGLSAAFYANLTATNPSTPMFGGNASGASTAATATTGIFGQGTDYVFLTGTNTIYAFSTAPVAGAEVTAKFLSTAVLNTSAMLSIPGNIPVTTAAGDIIQVRADSVSQHRVIGFYRASGVPVASAQTSGFVFAGPASGAAAAPEFRALVGAESGQRLLQTITSGTTSWITFTGLVSTYTAYKVIISELIPASDNVELRLQVSLDAGTSFVSTGSLYIHTRYFNTDNSAAMTASGSASDNQYVVAAAVGNAGSRTLAGEIDLYNPAGTNTMKRFQSDIIYGLSGGTVTKGQSGGAWQSTASYNGFRLLMGSGNISTVAASLYGFRKE